MASLDVSVAMATFNGEAYLQEQLDSLRSQTRQPNELVVCDDGSSDFTLDILEAFQERVSFPVRIHRNPTQLGYIKNFEKSLSLATGDIIFLCDQDDVWLDHKIERVLKAFELHPEALLVVNDAELVHANLRRTGLTVAGQLVSAGAQVDQLLLGCCMAFRSALRPLVLPVPDHIHGHDGWLNTLGRTLNCRYFVPEVLQLYRRHEKNTSTWPTTSTRPATRWHLLRAQLRWGQLKEDPCAASGRRLEQLRVLKRRLEAHEGHLQKILPPGSQGAGVMAGIRQEEGANESRRYLQQLPFIRRLIAGLRFYLAGGYRQFQGWKSLARDIVR